VDILHRNATVTDDLTGFFENHSPKTKTKLVIVGWGPAEDELKELSAHLDLGKNVIFAGKCDPSETQDYYRLGDCFVSASLTETQGLTYMEAMAARLIVLARYDDNLAHTISEGESGFFFFSEDDLVEKFDTVIHLDAAKRKKIEAGALKAIDPYSMQRFYENVYEVYERVRKKNW
jgi:1,2-diacylglycerol 3-alpha-glucosyltransferase